MQVFLHNLERRTNVEHHRESVRRRKRTTNRTLTSGKRNHVERFLYVPLPVFAAPLTRSGRLHWRKMSQFAANRRLVANSRILSQSAVTPTHRGALRDRNTENIIPGVPIRLSEFPCYLRAALQIHFCHWPTARTEQFFAFARPESALAVP